MILYYNMLLYAFYGLIICIIFYVIIIKNRKILSYELFDSSINQQGYPKSINRQRHARCIQSKPIDVNKCLSTPTCGIYYDQDLSDGICLSGTPERPNITLPPDIPKINSYDDDIYRSKKWQYANRIVPYV